MLCLGLHNEGVIRTMFKRVLNHNANEMSLYKDTN